ncbi:MAG: 2,3,4,5-tetrahydropyridine-2,6-dicarboxylate N-succinyltransferase, partial [Rhodospirillales bacterium]|nr:2,3,4,5-tetrahydropyridine-2,6-dicarboxylate N-succinyltransferase [Rhodospirillales bacterium]
MTSDDLKTTIEAAWETRGDITAATGGASREAVEQALDGLDRGAFRVAEKIDGAWHVHQWLKKAVLLSFRLNDSKPLPGGPRDEEHGEAAWYDKVPSKFADWGEAEFQAAGFRAVPNCVVR